MNTSSALADRQRELAKATNVHADSLTRLDRLQQSIADRQGALANTTRLLAQTERDLSNAQEDRITIGRGVLNIGAQKAAQDREHIKNANELRRAQLELQRIRLYDGDREDYGERILRQQRAILELQKRDAKELKNLRNASLDLARAKDAETEAAQRVKKIQGDVNALLAEGTKRTNELASAKKDLASAERDAAAASEDVARHRDRVNRASRSRDLARRGYLDAEDHEGGRRRHGRGGFGGGQGGNALGGIFTSIPFVPGGKAGAVIGSGLVTILGSVAEGAVTASQSLWLLPAALTAGAAGFATLKIGLSGFDKALKDMGDAKKFAQDLQGLSPAAQQAALEIQHLVGGMNGLKNLIQEGLFKNVAPMLHSLGAVFMPQLRQMFTGIAGAFNQMFTGAIGQLTTGSSGGVAAVMNNIVLAFQNLAPAMAPTVDAFVKIAQVGSSFLPGLATAIANAAKRFDDFITNAQKTGQLQHWIQQGLQAAQALGHFIGELAHKIYDVFGNKSPQQFADALHGAVGAAVAVGQAIVGISSVVNTLVRDLQPVANALGGWPNLIWAAVGAFAAFKSISVFSGLISSLGIVKRMLASELPAAAREGAAGITAALGGKIAASLGIAGGVAAAGAANAATSTSPTDLLLKNLPFGLGPIASGGLHLFQGLGGHSGKDKVVPGTPVGPDGKPAGGPNNTPNAPYWSAGDPNAAPPPWIPGPGQAPMVWQPGQGYVPMPGGDWSPYDVPQPPGKKGKKPHDYTPYGDDYTAPPRPGESSELYSAEGEVLNARHRLEQDRATLQDLEKDNNATAEDIQEAKNKIAEDQRSQNEAEMRLNEARENAVKKTLKGLKDANDEFNNIDQDFGLSQGLPGLIKNLVGMLGDIAAAPLMGKLKAIANATGTDSNTFGAFGMMGQRNIAQGKSPLLGIPAGQPGGLSPENLQNLSPEQQYALLSPEQRYAIYGNGGPGGTAGGPGSSTVPGSGAYGNGNSGVFAMPGFSQAPGAPQVGLAGAFSPAGGPGGGVPLMQNANGTWTSPNPAWAHLINRESGGINQRQKIKDANSGGNEAEGLFQITPATWRSHGGTEFAPNPLAATPQEQAAIAARILQANPSGSDWGAGLPGRENAGALMAGLRGSTASSWTPQYGSGGGGGGWLGAMLASSYSPMGGIGGFSPAGGMGAMGLPLGDARGVPLAPNVEAGIRSIGGLPTNYPTSGPGAYQVPAWVQQLAAQFGLTASTYASGGSLHQMGYAFDFNGPRDKQDEFSDYISQYLKDQTLQLIHQDGGRDWGIASGQSVGPGTSMPGYYAGDFGGHQDHVHWAPMPATGGLVGSYSSPGANVHQGILADVTRPDPNSIGNVGSAPAIVPNPSGRQGMSIPDWMNTLPSQVGGTGGGPGLAQAPYPSGVGNAGAVPPPGGTGAPSTGGPGGPSGMPVGSGPPGGIDQSAPPTPIGAPSGGGWQPSGGGANGIGGLPEAAAIAGASMFPGGGAAAQTMMKLLNRTIGYGQQAAAIGAEGALDFFKVSSPDSDAGGLSDLSKSWYGRVLQGFAGARPAIPSGAGKAAAHGKDSDPTKDPTNRPGGGQGGQGGDTTHNLYGNNGILAMPGSNVTVQGGQQPTMSDTSTGLSTQSTSPGSAAVAGMTVA